MGVSHDVPLLNSGNTIVLILVVCKMLLPRCYRIVVVVMMNMDL